MKPALHVDIVVEEPLWRKAGILADLRRAAREVIQRAAPSTACFARATSPVNGGGKTSAHGFIFSPPLAGEVPSAARRRGRAGETMRSATLLLTDDAKLQDLNARFRGKDKPTNVLSFPAHASDYLGDVAIAYGVTAREAAQSGKTFRDHSLHLAVHGVLHLLGYDHETAREARRMEPLEISILAELGIADPYVVRPASAVMGG